MQRITSFFSNLRLRNKFIIAYGVLLIIPLIVTGVLFYKWLATVAKEQTIEITYQSIKQAELHITYLKEQVENMGDMIFWNPEFRELLKEKDTIRYEQVEEYQTIINTLKRIEESPKIYKARIYVLDNKIYANNKQNIFPLKYLQGDPYFLMMTNEQNKKGWTDCYEITSNDRRKEKIISYMLVLNDFDNFGQVIGCLCIDILEKEIQTILSEIKIGDNGFVLMINSNGNIISTTYPLLKESNDADIDIDIENMLSLYLENRSEELKSYDYFRWNDKSYFVINMPIENSNWEILYIMPTSEIMQNVEAQIKVTMVIIAGCIILAAAIAVVVSNKITKGIKGLINRMEEVRGTGIETVDNNIIEYTKDEIGQLQYHFDRMMEKIRDLVKENYEVQLKRREAELRALQAQINPHFLYNVLDSINWMAIRAGAMNISEMVTDLGHFYRIGLRGGKEVITIREELEHVKTYLKIQKVRFDDTIKVDFDVAEEILNYPIVKFTLQPIVENAIVHGILTKSLQEGIIKITGEKREKQVLIKVIDDGTGIDFKKINSILSGSSTYFSRGFGIRNVNERIKLYFGEQYGVKFYREEGKWTVVEISLPAERSSNL